MKTSLSSNWAETGRGGGSRQKESNRPLWLDGGATGCGQGNEAIHCCVAQSVNGKWTDSEAEGANSQESGADPNILLLPFLV